MILKILGTLDILSAIFLWLSHFFNILPEKFIVLIAFYLIVKGVIFLISADIASILDVISGGIIFLSLSYSLPGFLIILVVLFLIQKGIFSWVA